MTSNSLGLRFQRYIQFNRIAPVLDGTVHALFFVGWATVSTYIFTSNFAGALCPREARRLVGRTRFALHDHAR